MKTFKISVQMLLLVLFASLAKAQGVGMVTVGFPDGSAFYGNLADQTVSTITVDFIESGARYVFDNSGNILQSNGKYKAGGKVNMIVVSRYERDLYENSTLHSSDMPLPLEVGIVFNDNRVYYGAVEASAEAGWFSILFYHSGSRYTMHREGAVWKVWSTDKGAYPPGHPLNRIFKLSGGEIFYLTQ